MDEEFEIEDSSLSGEVVRDGEMVDIRIYRGRNVSAWILK